MYQDILYRTDNKWQHENKHKLVVVDLPYMTSYYCYFDLVSPPPLVAL